jgi:hypothetical protein
MSETVMIHLPSAGVEQVQQLIDSQVSERLNAPARPDQDVHAHAFDPAYHDRVSYAAGLAFGYSVGFRAGYRGLWWEEHRDDEDYPDLELPAGDAEPAITDEPVFLLALRDYMRHRGFATVGDAFGSFMSEFWSDPAFRRESIMRALLAYQREGTHP